jgi:hypothetical protein
MDNFVPGFRTAIVGLTVTLRVVVFFVCVAGLMLQVRRAREEIEGLTAPLVRGMVVVGLVAGLPYWFGFTESVFLTVANTVRQGYTDHPMQTAERMRASVTDTAGEFSIRRVGESFYKAFLWAAAKLVVLGGSLLQLPFLLLQYVLKLLCYLFLPVALALFMVPGLEPLGVRYVQQTLAILAWPVGFAVTELAAYYLLTAYQNDVAGLQGLVPGELDASSLASLLGGLLAAIWIGVGTLGTPVVMQLLFCSGTPLSAGSQSAVQQIGSMQQVIGLVKSVKTGGIAGPALMAGAAAKPGGGGTPPSPPPAPPPPVSPAGPMGPRNDPAGDRRSAALLAQTRLPQAQTTL